MAIDLESPPMPETPNPDFDQSRMALARYIEWVGYLLARMYEYREEREEDDIPYFEPALTELYAAAFLEFLDQGHVQRVAAHFREPEDREQLERMMFLHGLTGRQVYAKMAFSDYYTLGLRSAARKRARAFLSRLLATVNSLLKSALMAVPGGAAIDEIKQLVENMRFLEDSLDG
ncbi:MAG: hypothetical protein GC147_08115 [Porphyrobacter sp.]|nr:hypothetical protein [Porphyrobacter sp.]